MLEKVRSTLATNTQSYENKQRKSLPPANYETVPSHSFEETNSTNSFMTNISISTTYQKSVMSQNASSKMIIEDEVKDNCSRTSSLQIVMIMHMSYHISLMFIYLIVSYLLQDQNQFYQILLHQIL